MSCGSERAACAPASLNAGARLHPERHRLLKALRRWAGNSERRKGWRRPRGEAQGAFSAPAACRIPWEKPGRVAGERGAPRSGALLDSVRQEPGAGALLWPCCPWPLAEDAQSIPPLPPGLGSGTRRRAARAGGVLEGSCGAGTLGKAGGRLQKCHGNDAVRCGFIAPPPRPTARAQSPLLPRCACGCCEQYPGVFTRCLQIPGGKSTAQMLRVINIYGAKIITAGRQQIAVNGRGGQSPSLARSSAGPGAWGSPGAPAPPGGAGSCPATFSEHRCLPFRSPHCSASRAEPGLTHALGSAAGAGCQLCLGEDPGAALIKSREVDSDPVMYSPGKVTRLCLITVLCLESFPASLADIYLDFTQGLLISSLA